jgi:hypothetical protein
MASQRLRTSLVMIITAGSAALLLPRATAQERKPVPKDSARVIARGCTKGYIFTAGPRAAEEPGTLDIREGMHLRMNGPKKVMAEIKAHEGQAIEIIGLMKKGQYLDGVNIGGGVRVSPGSSGGGIPNPGAGQPQVDLESWRVVPGGCPTQK